MKFFTKSRYALRVMIELARHSQTQCIPLKFIAEKQNISLKYLEQIIVPLSRAGLVRSERGSQGGYRLTKQPSEYTAGEILRAVEGSLASVTCLSVEDYDCPRRDECPSRRFWAGLDEVVSQYVDSVSLAELCSPDCCAVTE
jgi:Rrf2 family protein